MKSNNIKTARVNLDLTQAEAASKLGVSASTLSKWETGELDPSSGQIIAMCRLYKVSADALIGIKPIVNIDRY